MDLETYELVILRRPPNPMDYDEDTLNRLQLEHLAFYDDLRARNICAINGPVLDQPDESLRGFGFFVTGSLETAREIAEQDPSVQAGRLVVEAMTFWTQPQPKSRRWFTTARHVACPQKRNPERGNVRTVTT